MQGTLVILIALIVSSCSVSSKMGSSSSDKKAANSGAPVAPGDDALNRDSTAETIGALPSGRWNLSFRHLDINQIGLSEDGMDFGLAKALNSVSRSSEVVSIQSLAGGLAYSIDPNDFKIPAQLQASVASCPHLRETNIDGQGFWEADSFMYCILEPRIYYQLMGIARAGNMETRTERLFLSTQRAQGNHSIVGVIDSAVANGNDRLMERIEMPDGKVYWGTADYLLPGGIAAAMQSGVFPEQSVSRVGELKAGEFMWEMDNGFIGFALSGFGAQARYEANINVASDRARDDGLVIAGFGCMSCHSTGFNTGTYTPNVGRGTATADYPSESEFRRLVENDNARYLAAMMKLGYSMETVLGPEPITAIVRNFEKKTATQFVPGDATGALNGN